mmetsp:Transcript_13020/g.31427  ORF Transcript_13020/g.31427 Transcript_13020/m.31427 type:complete len:220 (-) Transcript_13020:234-893(-)
MKTRAPGGRNTWGADCAALAKSHASSSRKGCTRGMRILNVVPLWTPSPLSTVTAPPITSTMDLVMISPSPVPCGLASFAPVSDACVGCWNGMNSSFCRSLLMPAPSSKMLKTTSYCRMSSPPLPRATAASSSGSSCSLLPSNDVLLASGGSRERPSRDLLTCSRTWSPQEACGSGTADARGGFFMLGDISRTVTEIFTVPRQYLMALSTRLMRHWRMRK